MKTLEFIKVMTEQQKKLFNYITKKTECNLCHNAYDESEMRIVGDILVCEYCIEHNN